MGRDIFAPSRKYLTPNLQLFTPKQYFFLSDLFEESVDVVNPWHKHCNIKDHCNTIDLRGKQ